jgi:hypothetical protein
VPLFYARTSIYIHWTSIILLVSLVHIAVNLLLKSEATICHGKKARSGGIPVALGEEELDIEVRMPFLT